LLISLMVMVLSACGSGSPPGPSGTGSGPSQGGSGIAQGTMRATVDGVLWTGRINVASIATGNFLVITGETGIGTPNQILLSISTPAQVGTQTVASGLVVGTYLIAPTVHWLAAGPQGSGTVTVSTLTSTSATGTFSFVLPPGNGTTTTKIVTDGAFNVRIPTP
jgi:hypothetical protein